MGRLGSSGSSNSTGVSSWGLSCSGTITAISPTLSACTSSWRRCHSCDQSTRNSNCCTCRCVSSGKGNSRRSKYTPSQKLPRTFSIVPFWVYTPVCKAQRVPVGGANTQYKKPQNRASNRTTIGPNQISPLPNKEDEEALLKMRSPTKNVNEYFYHVAHKLGPHKKDPQGCALRHRPHILDGF